MTFLSFFRRSLWLLLCGASLSLPAQHVGETLHFSQNGVLGTARSMGMGGAFSAVGADLGTVPLNPAGLGVFRNSTAVITPSFRVAQNQANYYGDVVNQNRTRVNLPNLGVAFTTRNYFDNGRTREEIKRGLKAYTIAFGYNQLENYSRTTRASTFNSRNSVTDALADRATLIGATFNDLNNQSLAVFDSLFGVAFGALAIDTIAGANDIYFPAVVNGRVQQDIERKQSGRRNEWFVGGGANFSDKFYLGASIGIQTLNYENRLFILEQDTENLHEFFQPDPTNPNFSLETPMNEVTVVDSSATNGIGINARFGFILRPVDALRVGLSVQTPTYLALTRQYVYRASQNYTTNTGDFDLSASSRLWEYDYSLTTPYQLTLGLMYLLGKSGFITADADFIDYRSASINPVADLGSSQFRSFDAENARIDSTYRATFNVRIGGEYRYDMFRLRAGVAYFGSPLSESAATFTSYDDSQQTVDNSRKFFTLGAGLRQRKFFADVSYVNQQQQGISRPYSISEGYAFNDNPSGNIAAPLENRTVTHLVALSFGFIF